MVGYERGRGAFRSSVNISGAGTLYSCCFTPVCCVSITPDAGSLPFSLAMAEETDREAHNGTRGTVVATRLPARRRRDFEADMVSKEYGIDDGDLLT